MAEATYLALVRRAAPIHTKAALDKDGVACTMALPRPGTRRILVLHKLDCKLAFDVREQGWTHVLRYKRGEWERALHLSYQRAIQVAGSPPEPWPELMGRPDKSRVQTLRVKLLNVLLWPLVLRASQTPQGMRISLRLTAWQLFFWGVSLYGVFLAFMQDLSGVAEELLVLLWLVGTFLSAFVMSMRNWGSHLSPQYIESLKAVRDYAQEMKHLAEKRRLNGRLSHVVQAQTISVRAERGFREIAATVRIDEDLKRSLTNFLFLANTWVSISLANDSERAGIIFGEVLLDPAKHSYLRKVFGRARKPQVVALIQPDTWVEPIARGAQALGQEIRRRLPLAMRFSPQ